MLQARVIQSIVTGLALAGIVGACAVIAGPEYTYHRLSGPHALTRELSAYDQCVAAIRNSGEHQDLADLEIDAKCPVRPSDESLRSAVIVARSLRDGALRFAGVILVLSALPWVASHFSRKRRLAVSEHLPVAESRNAAQ